MTDIELKDREDGKVLVIRKGNINLEIPIRIERNCAACPYSNSFCLNIIRDTIPCTQIHLILLDKHKISTLEQIVFDVDLGEYRAMIPILCRLLDNDSQIVKKKQVFKRRKL